jgi:hypothetical protein
MGSLTGLGLKIERLAKQQSELSVGATVATILDRRAPGPPVPDEVLAQTRVGRPLLARRRRAEAGYPGRGG